MRIAGDAVQVVRSEPAVAKGGHVRLADDHRARLLQVGGGNAVLGDAHILHRDKPGGGGVTGKIGVDLTCDRDAVKRTDGTARLQSPVSGIGCGQRLVIKAMHHGIQRRVHGIHACKGGFGCLAAGDAARTDGRGGGGGVERVKIIAGHRCPHDRQ
jgi:hypothetical protein